MVKCYNINYKVLKNVIKFSYLVFGEEIIMNWEIESKMFDKTADYYDKFRPSYPEAIIKKIIELARINENSRVLEIGAGSGKATELFAPKNIRINCIEPGETLVRNGRIKLFQYDRIKFEISTFEEAQLDANFYDLIFSAQAFHWIFQPIGYEKCAYTLKSKGYLALFWNMYITYDNELDKELIKLSNKYGGFADFLSEEECEARIQTISEEIKNSGYFTFPQIYRVLWNKEYTAEEYYGFVKTGNRFIQKSEKEKLEAYGDICKLADEHGGILNRPYLCVLYLAQKQ